MDTTVMAKLMAKPTVPWPAPAEGVDVSEWNYPVDWQAVRRAGKTFAIVRLGYGRDTLDSLFYRHVNEALAAGLGLGVYRYSYAVTALEAREEARHTVYILRDCGLTPDKLPLGIWYDMEDSDDYKANHGVGDDAAGRALMTDCCLQFAAVMQSYGYPYVGVYANWDWWTHRLEAERLPMAKWVAQYNDTCDIAGAALWQYTSTLSIEGMTLDGVRLLA